MRAIFRLRTTWTVAVFHIVLLFQLDMDAFEEAFKTRAQDTEADRARMLKIVEAKQKRGTSIIDVNRARNLCKPADVANLSIEKSCVNELIKSRPTQQLFEFLRLVTRVLRQYPLRSWQIYERT